MNIQKLLLYVLYLSKNQNQLNGSVPERFKTILKTGILYKNNSFRHLRIKKYLIDSASLLSFRYRKKDNIIISKLK